MISLGILVVLTLGVIVWVSRQSSISKLSRSDRLLGEEGEFKRTFINLVALEFKKYVLEGNILNNLIKTCSKEQAKFTPWYASEYQGAHYAVSVCDNYDANTDYTIDADQTLWFKIDATYPGGRDKTYYALLTPQMAETPTPSPSPGVTPTPEPTKTPELLCFHDTATVPCPSPTPCDDGKGNLIPCPSPTPCQAQDKLGIWGVVNAFVFVPCQSCTDKFGASIACPSPTIPSPPPSPTPTPTPSPPPSPTAPPSPTPPPCSHNPAVYVSGGVLNTGMSESVTATACGTTLLGTVIKEGNQVRFRCFRDGVLVGTQLMPFNASSMYWMNTHISFQYTYDNPGTVFCWGEKTPYCLSNCYQMYQGTVY